MTTTEFILTPTPSAAPIVDQGVSVPTAALIDIRNDLHTTAGATLVPMENLLVDGTFAGSRAPNTDPQSYSDSFQLDLKKGQVIDFSADVEYNYQGNDVITQTGDHSSTYWITNSSNKVLYSGGFQDPDNSSNAGPAPSDADLVFQVPLDGQYTFNVGRTTAQEPGSPKSLDGISYTAAVRLIQRDSTPDSALDPYESPGDAAKLAFAGGGMYAWFSPASGDTNDPVSAIGAARNGYLTLTGPTGRGFQIQGDWAEQEGPNGSITYTASGTLGLESALGTISLPLPKGISMVVQASDPGSAGLFGLVKSATVQVSGTGLAKFTDQLKGINFSSQSLDSDLGGVTWGIGLGGAVATATGAPTNPAVPYLYFSAGDPLSVNYGGATLTSKSGAVGLALKVAIDPADPMAYVDVEGIPVVNKLALAFSPNDLIPYTPEYALKGYDGSIYGDVYYNGTINFGDISDELVPVILNGGAVLDFDPSHVGFTGSAEGYASDFARAVADPAADGAAFFKDLSRIGIGEDGQASLGISKDGLSLTIPVGGASLAWDGATDTAYFHGEATSFGGMGSTRNPLSGIAKSGNTTIDVEATVDVATGAFDFELGATYDVLGLTLGGTIEVDNRGVDLTGTVSLNTGVLGSTTAKTWVDLDGSVTVTLGLKENGDIDFGLDARGTFSYEFLGSGHTYGGELDFSETIPFGDLTDHAENIVEDVVKALAEKYDVGGLVSAIEKYL